MKSLPTLLLTCALATPSFAQAPAPKAAPAPMAPPASTAASAVAKPDAAGVITFDLKAAKITAPFALKDGILSQPEMTELAKGGKAIFEFTLEKAGTYVIQGKVKAESDDANSFFVNIDAEPADPLGIWDMDVNTEFEDQIAGWRGSGDAANVEFPAKRFTLAAGAHKLILVGREPALLKALALRPSSK